MTVNMKGVNLDGMAVLSENDDLKMIEMGQVRFQFPKETV